ncbi:MAG: transposase [Actinomycetota bacterium]|nr:transposase [Actinomycetota bacterium]
MRGRVHSREFKLDVVRQVASGAKRPSQACREYGLAGSVLDRWRQEYASRGEEAFTPRQPSRGEALEARIAELERHCGQLSLELSLVKKALQQAEASRSRSGTR